MHVRAFIEEMERLAPPDLAEDFDAGKIGLVVEGRGEIVRVCCALDATPYVIKKAVDASADMLVVHHTPLWTPVTAIRGRTAGLMRALLSADMNLYVMHTNFDRAKEGVNDVLAELLSLTDITPMSPGCIGTCTISPAEISQRLGGNIRLWGKIKKIRRLALVAGSGFDPAFIEEAKLLGADAFLSAEMKHSVARSSPLPCLEATHYALEAPAMQRLAKRRGWQYIDDPPLIKIIP
jgi:dinuclear metal center YbgI/SA1388 family protein